MSHLLNDKIIWVAIPRCASFAVENAFKKSDLKMTPCQKVLGFKGHEKEHLHIEAKLLIDEFGDLETLCIKRDWLERWLSGLKHFLLSHAVFYKNEPFVSWEEVDNDFIYETFDHEFCNKLYFGNFDDDVELCRRLLKKFDPDDDATLIGMLKSQNFYKINNKCTYEFDIKELYKLEKFIMDKFAIDIKINKVNESPKLTNKIVIDNELKEWIWDKFEKPFEKNNVLI